VGDKGRFAMQSSVNMSRFGKRDVGVEEYETRHERERDVHLAFLLTHGFGARTLLRSGVTKRLIEQGIRITIISPNADESYFQQECREQGVILKPEFRSTGRIADWFRAYRPYLLDDVMNNVALKTKHISRFENYPISGSLMAFINKTFAKIPFFRKLSRIFECIVNKSKVIKKLLKEINPDLLVLPNPFGTKETVFLLHARKLGIPVACQMLSWDNITSKGTPLLMPDYFISWGPIMTEEMTDLYHFPKDKIYECGVPHFDVYFQRDKLTPQNIILKEFNLPQDEPYILYAMVAPYSAPNELDVLSWLADQINKGAFTKPCSLIIRPHPQTIRGVYARNTHELERLKALVGPRVALDTPPVLSDQLAWDLPKSDMYRLASLLAGSAMCLSAGSTLCLEACILDRPVVNIGFDGWEDLPYEKSARRGLDYTHIVKCLALGGVRVARSFHDLEAHINAYLCNPHLDQRGRALTAAQECGPQDGHAAERVATTLLKLGRMVHAGA
jgi:CDP-glycerol glycerophosphotransferase (TagB/SpsB family)